MFSLIFISLMWHPVQTTELQYRVKVGAPVTEVECLLLKSIYRKMFVASEAPTKDGYAYHSYECVKVKPYGAKVA